MRSFKSYLVEAQFSEENFKRLISVIERRLPKLLGGHIYRCGGDTGVQHLSNGMQGYLYFFGGDKAFQVRCKAGKVLGIDIWKKFTIDAGPSFTADLHEFDVTTIIGALTKLAKIIRSPHAGEISIKEALESEEGQALMEMAKRVKDEDFYAMMKQAYGADGAKSVTWEQIAAVAKNNDVLIPRYIRDQKIGRGKWNSEPGSVDTVDSAGSAPDEEPKTSSSRELAHVKAEPVVGKKHDILYIKVTAQDPVTKRFLPTSDSADAQKMLKQIRDDMDGPPPEAELKDPETLYGHLAELVSDGVQGFTTITHHLWWSGYWQDLHDHEDNPRDELGKGQGLREALG
jgi:hypothetical protein